MASFFFFLDYAIDVARGATSPIYERIYADDTVMNVLHRKYIATAQFSFW